MKDFMVEGTRYVFQDEFKTKEILDVEISDLKFCMGFVLKVISRALIEPKMSVEELGELTILESIQLTAIVSELYFGNVNLEEIESD